MSNILSAFNDHFLEFINDVQLVFPDDVDVLSAKNSLMAIRKANPKMIVKIWKIFIGGKYKQQIEAGDISFFIEKDYSADIQSTNSDQIMYSINRLRNPIKNMGKENQSKVMTYIYNLTKLSDLCDS